MKKKKLNNKGEEKKGLAEVFILPPSSKKKKNLQNYSGTRLCFGDGRYLISFKMESFVKKFWPFCHRVDFPYTKSSIRNGLQSTGLLCLVLPTWTIRKLH